MVTLPYSRLPGINSLFLDFVENRERVSEFYPSEERLRSAKTPHRDTLCEILAKQNQDFGNLSTTLLIEKLRAPESYCVITGQQIGLLTGPMYTIWKALTMIHLCRQLEKERGANCIPVFWMATEDHNWHEIMNFALLKEDFSLLEFSLKDHLFLKRQPTGTIPTHHEEVRRILLRAFQLIHNQQIKQFYSSGTLTEAFARTLLWLLRDFPILIVDPSDPRLKQLAAPFFNRFFDLSSEMMESLQTQNETLKGLNYPTQVKLENGTLPMFYIDGLERKHLQQDRLPANMDFTKLSPAALLRPLFQDFLFPTAVYVGGPAEIAYFAQIRPWYQRMEIEQPQLAGRASLTLLPSPTRKFLTARKLEPEELYLKEDTLMDALVENSNVEQIRNRIRSLKEVLQGDFYKIRASAKEIDRTLEKVVSTSERKVNYQMEKLERKTFFAAKRKDHILASQLRNAKNVVHPGEKLQERYLNIFSFSSRLPDLIHEVFTKIDFQARGHQWIEI